MDLLWGPDGWIYGVTSSNGGTIHNRSRPDAKPVSVRGRDFRFKADGSAFEAISGGGQFGHSFDDWGHRFTCNNSNHVRQIVLPSHYLERNPGVDPAVCGISTSPRRGRPRLCFGSAPPSPGGSCARVSARPIRSFARRLPPTELFATGFFTSATGVTIYRGSSYPPSYRGNVFVGDVGGNLVHRKILTADGPTFLAQRADSNVEFLASTDNWFRPVNFANTPDGTLLLIDMYRETIEHPLSIPEPIKKHLDLTSGNDRGRLYNLVYSGSPRGRGRTWAMRPRPSWFGCLPIATSWWRETAQRLLFERQDRSVVERLKAMVKDRPTALGRLHALWTLQLLEVLDTESIICGLDDPEPRVREQAIRLAETRLTSEPELLCETAATGRRQRPHGPTATCVFARRGQRRSARDRGPGFDRHRRRRRASGPARPYLSSIAGHSLAFLDDLSTRTGFLTTDAGQAWLDELAFLVGSERDPGQSGRLLDALARCQVGTQPLMRATLALGRGRQRAGGSIRKVLEGTKSNLAASLLADAAGIAGSDGLVEDRLVAIRLLGLADRKTARDLLPGLLDARQPTAVQLGGLAGLGRFPRPRSRPTDRHALEVDEPRGAPRGGRGPLQSARRRRGCRWSVRVASNPPFRARPGSAASSCRPTRTRRSRRGPGRSLPLMHRHHATEVRSSLRTARRSSSPAIGSKGARSF